MASAFVIYDFTIKRGLGDTLADLVADSAGGVREVTVLGRDDVKFGDLARDHILPGIASATRGLAIIDKPNANVGLEIGYAYGLGKELALVAWGNMRPAWLRRPPLNGFLFETAVNASRLREILDAKTWGPPPPPRSPSPAPSSPRPKLLLCATEGAGETYSKRAQGLGHQFSLLPKSGWNLRDLDGELAKVESIVWIIAPVPGGDGDERDGADNAADAVIAGFAMAIGLPVKIFRSAQAREVADVVHFAREFSDLKDLEAQLRADIGPASPASSAMPSIPKSLMLQPIYVRDHYYTLPEKFVGRVDELTHLRAILVDSAPPKRPRIFSVIAIGGTGKSCLIRHFIDSIASADGYRVVAWYSFYLARTEDEIYFLRGLLEDAFGRVPPPPRDNDTGAVYARLLRKEVTKALDEVPTLLVLDGVEILQLMDDPNSSDYGKISARWTEVLKLLQHLASAKLSRSACVLTSRAALRDFEKAEHSQSIDLKLLSESDGAALLASLHVKGTSDELRECARLLGCHALCLRAAGLYLSRRKIAARDIGTLGGGRAFEGTSEGEKVKRIVDWYRDDLSPEQEYFLTRMSLHPRPVESRNFPALVRGTDDIEVVLRTVVEPLVERGLLEVVEAPAKEARYTAHPLMKLAYSSWLTSEQAQSGHVDWAMAAVGSPLVGRIGDDFGSLEEMEPLIDASEHYLKARRFEEARAILLDRGVLTKIGRLGYYRRTWELGCRLEAAMRCHTPSLESEYAIHLMTFLAWTASHLGRHDDRISYAKESVRISESTRSYHLDQAKDVLAKAYVDQGMVADAERLAVKSPFVLGVVDGYRGKLARATRRLRLQYRSEFFHTKTVLAQYLAGILIAGRELVEARSVVDQAISLARSRRDNCCLLPLLGYLIEIELLEARVDRATIHHTEVESLRRDLDLESSEDVGILLAEHRFDDALDAIGEEPERVHLRVAWNLSRGRALLGLQRVEEARAALAAARAAAEQSGYFMRRRETNELAARIRAASPRPRAAKPAS